MLNNRSLVSESPAKLAIFALFPATPPDTLILHKLLRHFRQFRINLLNRGVQKRSIDSTRYPFLTWPTQANTNTPTLDYQYTKVGEQSFELTFRLNDPGEYAIYVTGSDKSFSLFGTVE